MPSSRPLRSLLLPVAVAVAAAVQAPTATAETVNTTMNIPANVRDNPCMPGDVVNTSGTLHIVLSTRTDSRGGHHVNMHTNEEGKGQSLTTGVSYLASEVRDESWYAGAPFPTTHTTTHSLLLVSQASTPNLVLRYTLHVTVNALGVPTATVENVRTECAG
jgi:hypothetical protein